MQDAPITGEMLVGSYGFHPKVQERRWGAKVTDINVLAMLSKNGNWNWRIWKDGEGSQKVPWWVCPQTKAQLNHFIQRLHWRKAE